MLAGSTGSGSYPWGHTKAWFVYFEVPVLTVRHQGYDPAQTQHNFTAPNLKDLRMLAMLTSGSGGYMVLRSLHRLPSGSMPAGRFSSLSGCCVRLPLNKNNPNYVSMNLPVPSSCFAG